MIISTSPESLFKRDFRLSESVCTIISDREEAVQAAISSIEHHRGELEEYIKANPVFQYALESLRVQNGPKVATLMAEATDRAGVGPMAAVAGVLADLAVEEMLEVGARVAIVENGGEASFVSDRPVDVALQAGDAPLSRRVGFRLESFPIGVATSSGLFSHALSLGEAEAVTVFAGNAGLADAAATAVGNLVKGENEREAVARGVERGLSIRGVSGVLILYRGHVGMGGEVPPLIGVDPSVATAEAR
jgi:ApbE superfamily uncharacterized protein (UPF0280 family)